ncbi:MAG: DUF1189 family protein [Victivallales bacterium]|nr:DUF1189 family protein [Victivallales bacterium]
MTFSESSANNPNEAGSAAAQGPDYSFNGEKPVSLPLPMMPKLKFFSLLLGLFIYPRLAILNVRVHSQWIRALSVIIVSALLAAFLQAILSVPEFTRQCDTISKYCADTLHSLTYMTDTNTFSWDNNELQLPSTHSLEGCRIDFLNDKESFDRKAAIDSDDIWGMFFSQKDIGVWSRNVSDTRSIIIMDNLPNKKLAEIFRQLGTPHENSFTLNHDGIMRVGRMVVPCISLCCGIFYSFVYFQLVFTCVIIFVIMSLLFNRIDKAPFSAVVASSLACVIPPFLLTLVASLLPFVTIDIDTLFTIFFVIYLIIIFLDRSVVIRQIRRI